MSNDKDTFNVADLTSGNPLTFLFSIFLSFMFCFTRLGFYWDFDSLLKLSTRTIEQTLSMLSRLVFTFPLLFICEVEIEIWISQFLQVHFTVCIVCIFFSMFNCEQSKIQSLAGQHSDILESLSPNVRKRVEVLREIQV